MAFSHWYPASFRRAFVESFADQNKLFRTLTRNTALAILMLSVPLCFAQHDSSSSSSSSSSGGGGHSSGSASAPSFSAPTASSHSASTSFSTSVSSSSANTHSPTGHVGGNPPHPYPGPGTGPTPHLKWNGGGGTVDVYPDPYPVYIPYAVDDNSTTADANASDDSEADDCQGGPTVFDGCGTGAASYIPPVDPGPVHTLANDSDATASLSASEPASDPTLLVFKDGHQLEVQNYAVLGQTLYDLTPGHRRKIAMAELDLPATEKANDDRGISFELPASPQAN